MFVLTFGAVGSFVAVNAVALAEVAAAVSTAVVGTGRRDTLGLADHHGNFLRFSVVVVDAHEPASSVQVLQQGDVDHHALDAGDCGRALLSGRSCCGRGQWESGGGDQLVVVHN